MCHGVLSGKNTVVNLFSLSPSSSLLADVAVVGVVGRGGLAPLDAGVEGAGAATQGGKDN